MKRFIYLVALFTLSTGLSADPVLVIGVTEPVQEIDLAFPEPGIIAEMSVKEGQVVKRGDLLARLDARSLEARQKIAALKAESEAAVRSSAAELKMREERVEKLERLGSGNTNPDEVSRARVDYEAALSRYELAMEESTGAKIELEQITVEIERRILRSPIDGIVTRIHRDEAESVSGGETLVMSVVNLDELDLIVHVETDLAEQVGKMGKVIVDRVGEAGRGYLTDAGVKFVSPVVDASSGTRRVRLRIDNKSGHHVSGVKYQVQLSAPESLGMLGQ